MNIRKRDLLEKILIIGSSGEIGSHLYNYLETRGYSCYGTIRNKNIDKNCISSNLIQFNLLEDSNRILSLHEFSWCIIVASESSIKYCEENPIETSIINVERIIDLIDKCAGSKISFIYISSNEVFDGKSQFRMVNEIPNPATRYGAQKFLVEDYIQSNCNDLGVILRITKIISKTTPIILKWNRSLSNGKKIVAYTDKFISPVSIYHVCKVIASIIRQRQYGLFQLGGASEISYFDFALQHYGDYKKIIMAYSHSSRPFASLMTYTPTLAEMS